MGWRTGKIWGTLACGLALSLVFAPSAAANNIEVTTTADDLSGGTPSTCSLREAIVSANADAGGVSGCASGSGTDQITFNASLNGQTINLTDAHGELLISTSMTITGPGMNQLTVDGPSNDRVIEITLPGPPPPQVQISGMTIQGGNRAENDTALGGGIRNAGDLDLIDVKVANNSVTATGATSAHTSVGGGGIDSSGPLTLDNSVVTGNTALAQENGAGTNDDATADGGGVNAADTTTISDSTIAGNFATTTATGASGDARTFGGGVSSNAPLSIDHSTINGNQASATSTQVAAYTYGGGLRLNMNTTIELSTITGNTVNPNGPGASNILAGGGITGFAGTLNLKSSTVAANGRATLSMVGANLDDSPGISMVLENTIVADAGPGSQNCDTPISSNGHNLDEDGTCGLSGTGDITGDPILSPLAANGAPTKPKTMALGIGSPALDKGTQAGQTTQNEDERGLARPQDATSIVNAVDGTDIGAFEVQGPAQPTITATDPVSPSQTNTTPHVIGTAPDGTDAPTTGVSIHGTACTGSQLGPGGTPTEFASPGLSVTVPANATTNLYAVSTNAYSINSCSTPFPYTHFTPSSPPPSGDTGGGTTTAPAPTGLRAAALAKCKKKHGRARARCKRNANKLPV
jgi:CSLREA domain-containing protein